VYALLPVILGKLGLLQVKVALDLMVSGRDGAFLQNALYFRRCKVGYANGSRLAIAHELLHGFPRLWH
jgi:hypothetical protein